MPDYRTIEWRDGAVRMLDQRFLPLEVVYRDYTDYFQIAKSIQEMVIRGAPAIGIAGAYGMALCACHSQAQQVNELLGELKNAAAVLNAARPTAANLTYATRRILNLLSDEHDDIEGLQQKILHEAKAIAAEEAAICQQIGQNALAIVPLKATFIHHCNTGALATGEYGTALGIIRTAHESGRQVFVYVDETRPRLQGARLTAWELQQLDIPHTVIVDGASGYIMKTRHVDLVTVGCDRVAANGDTANKIGTYNLALVARAHNVPFYIAAPTTTIDLSILNGDSIPIEERDPSEVIRIGKELIMPDGSQALNPAFDVTPAELITAIITETGIATAPYNQSLSTMVERATAQRQK